MERANFKRLTRKDIEAAIEGGASDWGINMDVDFDVFERHRVVLPGRGRGHADQEAPIFFWKKEEVKVDSYQRLVLMVKLKPAQAHPEQGATPTARLPEDVQGHPQAGPGDAAARAPRLQCRSCSGGRAGGFAVGTIWLRLSSACSELVAVDGRRGGWSPAIHRLRDQLPSSSPCWRRSGSWAVSPGKQYASYQMHQADLRQDADGEPVLPEPRQQRRRDDAGCSTRPRSRSAERRCWRTTTCGSTPQPRAGLSEQLDDYVEMELEGKVNLKVDFEIDDALDKLEKLNIVTEIGQPLPGGEPG